MKDEKPLFLRLLTLIYKIPLMLIYYTFLGCFYIITLVSFIWFSVLKFPFKLFAHNKGNQKNVKTENVVPEIIEVKKEEIPVQETLVEPVTEINEVPNIQNEQPVTAVTNTAQVTNDLNNETIENIQTLNALDNDSIEKIKAINGLDDATIQVVQAIGNINVSPTNSSFDSLDAETKEKLDILNTIDKEMLEKLKTLKGEDGGNLKKPSSFYGIDENAALKNDAIAIPVLAVPNTLVEDDKRKLTKEERIKLKREREDKNTYINENVVIEKKTIGDKINTVLEAIISVPVKIQKKIKASMENSIMAKNKRNQDAIERESLLINFEGDDAKKSDKKVVYEYQGKDIDGKVVTDYFEAFSKVEVHSFLLSEGFEVYSIRTNKMIQLLHRSRSVSGVKMKTKDLIFFLTQLSTYIKAGIPLAEAMHILSRQFRKETYQRLFKAMIYDLTMGESFSDCMSKQGEAFPRLLINMIKASEMTGELPEALDDMANYFTEADKTRKQMITALMYPSIVFVLAIAAITFIMVYIVPQFVEIYRDMDNAQLPGITVAVMKLSAFLEKNLLWIILGVILIAIVTRYLYKNVKLYRTFFQYIFMKVPIIGEVIIFNEVTMFTKTFASLLRHNVFITDTMEILNRITNNEIWKAIILDTITNLAKGEKISLSFENHWAVPIPAYEMIVTGEKTGQLPEMMQKVSDYYQELHKNAVGRIKVFIEPILILFLTGAVGVIVLSIVIPMFGMYNALS